MKILNLVTLSLLLIMSMQTAKAQNLSAKQDEKSQLYGFVDENDKYVVKPIYKEVDYNFGSKPGLSKVVYNNDKTGFVNDTGKEVVPCKYDEVESFENGYTVVKIKAGEYTYKEGLMDSTGKEVIPLKYGKMEYYPNDKVLIVGEESASNVGLMDLTGKMIIPAQYEFWSKRISKGLWPVGKNNICGVVNLKNETVVPFIYDMIEGYSDDLNLAPAKKDGKYGFIDRTGKVVVPFIYGDGWTSGPYLSVKKDGKWGVISTDSKVILPFEYASISSVNKKTAWVTTTENESAYEIDIVTKQRVKK